MKFENVMFQFMGDVGDYIKSVDFSASTFKLLDDLVDEILPQHNKVGVFEIDVEVRKNQTRGGGSAKLTEDQEKWAAELARRVADEKKSRVMPPPAIPFSAGQNSMVSRTFLSYDGLERAVARGKELGFAHDIDYQALVQQLDWCKYNGITVFTVELVMYFSQKYLRMHMDEDEIQKAMDSGKVYMIMAGMKQSPQADVGGKVIIPISLIRNSLTANMEIPTYDSHSVELAGHVSDESLYMTMEEGSVNMLVHFCDPADHVSEDMVLVGARVLGSSMPDSDTEMPDAAPAVDIGTFERITGEHWPPHIIEEIVAGCGTCTNCVYDRVLLPGQFKIRGYTAIVHTPAIHPTQNPKLSALLREQGMVSPFAMHVKVMSIDMNTLRVANQNVYLEYRAQTDACVPYVHANRSINCTEQMVCFMIPDYGSYNYPIYPSDWLCREYGLERINLDAPGWNVAAASVMFGMDFLINVTTKYCKDSEDLDYLYPKQIGPSPLYPNIKCITYLVPEGYLIETFFHKMPKTWNTSIFDFNMECTYIDVAGLEEEDDTVVMVACGGKTPQSMTEVKLIDWPVQKDEGEAPDGLVVRFGPNRTPVVHINFVLIE